MVTFDQLQVKQYDEIPFEFTRQESLCTHRLAVSPLHQQRGVSKELLRFGLELTAKRGLRALRIDCLSINPGPMHLFRTLGFKQVGEIFYPEKDPRVSQYPFYCFEKTV